MLGQDVSVVSVCHSVFFKLQILSVFPALFLCDTADEDEHELECEKSKQSQLHLWMFTDALREKHK